MLHKKKAQLQASLPVRQQVLLWIGVILANLHGSGILACSRDFLNSFVKGVLMFSDVSARNL